MIDQAKLRRILNYDPDTGIFTRRVKRNNRTKVGEPAGYIKSSTEKLSYREIEIDGVAYMAHRLAFLYMTGVMPSGFVDHINGDGLDNSWGNLRVVTHSENLRNSSMRTDNRSGVVGVSYYKQTSRWRAAINTREGTKKHLGYFDNLLDAAAARKSAEARYGYHENHGRRAA